MVKRLQDLTFKDNFMFSAVMAEKDNCRHFLEMILGVTITELSIAKEELIKDHPYQHGVRLDILAIDARQRYYDIEMQLSSTPIQKRARYYHGQMDRMTLLAGKDYDQLAESYVIFICDYDPLDRGKYCYTIKSICKEDPTIDYDDGRHTIFLNSHGKDETGVSQSLINFLHYVKEGCIQKEFENDAYVATLQKTVEWVKTDSQKGAEYMLMQEWLEAERKEARTEGRAEGRAEGLSEGKAEERLELLQMLIQERLDQYGGAADELKDKIRNLTDADELHKMLNFLYDNRSIEKIRVYVETL